MPNPLNICAVILLLLDLPLFEAKYAYEQFFAYLCLLKNEG